MAKLYGEIAAKSLLTLDKSFARANGQPLDASEVYYSLAAAREYAATAQAYIGQKIVVVENGVVTHYGIEDTLGNLKELGAKPVGDLKSIEVSETGTVSLKGVDSLAFERDVLDDEGQPTGQKETIQYQPLMTKDGLVWVEPSKTTVEGLATLIEGLSKRADAIEADVDAVEAAIGVASKAETTEGAGDAVAATGLHKKIEDETARALSAEATLQGNITAVSNDLSSNYATKQHVADEIGKIEIPVVGVAENDKVLSLDENKKIKSHLELTYDSENKRIELFGKDDESLGYVDATPFIKDGMLENVEYNADNNTLTFTWNILDGTAQKTDTVVLSDIIEPYTAGNGLALNGNEFSAVIDSDSEFLSVSENGIKVSGITEALKSYVTSGEYTAFKNDVESNYAKSADVANTYATKEFVGAIPSGYTETNIVSFIQKRAQEVLDAASGGTSESAASVKAALDKYKTDNDARVLAVEGSVSTLQSDLKTAKEKLATVEENAEKNIIEVVKVNGAALDVSAEDRSVNITIKDHTAELTALGNSINTNTNAISEVRSIANQGVTDAANAQKTADDNAKAIGTLNTTVADHGTAIGQHQEDIATINGSITALQNADNTHAEEYRVLNNLVLEHSNTLGGKADTADLAAAEGRIGANEQAIKAINETTIPGLRGEMTAGLNTKADASALNNYYTKTEIGTIAEGKTLVKMIEDAQSAATYDDEEIRGLIKTNTDALTVLNGGENDANSVRNIANAAASAAATAAVGSLVGAAPEALNTLEEIAKWIAADETGTAALIDRVAANETAIAAINSATDGILVSAKAYADEAASAAATAAVNGIPAATAETLGLVKVDNSSIKATDGVLAVMVDNTSIQVGSNGLEVKAVSTDLLVNGTETFVLNGGSAVAE